MEIIAERCAGLDVHHENVVACAVVGRGPRASKHTKEFSAHAQGLAELRTWLHGHGCTHVAMEGTGVYWLPVYAALEGHFQIIVGNAHHMKNVPGRKTDVLDAKWIGELVRHGLIRPSYVPPRQLRELRILTRYRSRLVHAQSAERNRVLKHLAASGLKLSTVATDVFGVSGMLMLRALAEGKQTAEQIARLARGTLKRKIPALTLALEGLLGEQQRHVLAGHLALLDTYAARMASVQAKIDAALSPYEPEIALLKTIPGVSDIVTAVILAEIGPDMSHWPNTAALSCWIGVSPGNFESAGRRASGRTPPGNRYLKTALVEAALAAAHSKGSYLSDKYFRLRARRGHGRAAMAIAHKLAIAIYHVLKFRQPYRELGGDYLDRQAGDRLVKQLTARLNRLGYDVRPQAPDAAINHAS